jgi:hypothetical protein
MVVVIFFAKKVPIEVSLKILHVWVDVPEGAVKIFGSTIRLQETLPDHARMIQEPVVGHEGIQLIGVPAEHHDMRFAQEREKFKVRG